MRRIVIVSVIAAVLLAAVPVQAGPIKAQALAAARKAAFVQAVDPTPRRSLVRTWSGIGMVGAGRMLAFSGNRECGTTGSSRARLDADRLLCLGVHCGEWSQARDGVRRRVRSRVHCEFESEYLGGGLVRIRAGAGFEALRAGLEPVSGGGRRACGGARGRRRVHPRIGVVVGGPLAGSHGCRYRDGRRRRSAGDRLREYAGRGDQAGSLGRCRRDPLELVRTGPGDRAG